MSRRATIAFALATMIVAAAAVSSYAQEEQPHAPTKKYMTNVFDVPTLHPDISASLGYSNVSLSGSRAKAAEFEYLKDSVYFSANHLILPYPSRFHFEVEVLNSKDQFWDMRYAYSDIVLARYVRRSIYHNLETIKLVDLDTSTASPSIYNPDMDEIYGLNVNIGDMFLRLKSPGFPFHVFVKDHYVYKEGDIQQRFIWGSGYYNNNVRASRGRHIEWKSHEVTYGANSHLGPVEMEIERIEKDFDPAGDRVLYDAYAAGSSRSDGTYAHNLYPRTTGETNSIKLHTSYTGRLVASMSMSRTVRNNSDSDASAHYVYGSGEIFARPFDRMVVSLKYKHVKSEPNNPDSLPVGYLGIASYTSSVTDVRDSLVTDKDTYTLDMRYAASPKTSFLAEYKYKNTSRANSDVWDLPASTIERTLTLTGRTRPVDPLKIEVKLVGQENSDTACNSTPDALRQGSISASLKPASRLLSFIKYTRSHGHSNETIIGDNEAGSRLTNTDKAYASVTLWPVDSLSFTAGAAYSRNSIKEDAYFGSTYEQGVEYRDAVYSYTAGVNLTASEKLSLGALVNLTRSRGGFASNTLTYTNLSDISAEERDYTITANYELSSHWDAGVEFKHVTYDNMIENYENPELTDGTASRAMVKLSKEFR